MESGATLPALYYDAECPMCTRSARFIRRRDRRATLRFEALTSDEGRALIASEPALAAVDSMIWVDHGDSGAKPIVRTHSAAVLAVAGYLGGGWAVLGALAGVVPAPVRDRVYRWVARHRPRAEHCEI
jgi:predicted DCC family thiol-disulfide oxidoreductase YuxK